MQYSAMTSPNYDSNFPTAAVTAASSTLLPATSPATPPTKTRGTFRRENEKKRSKCNRDKFKQYMCELNECMGFKKLSINKCLSTAVSLMKLSLFSEMFSDQDSHQGPSSLLYEVGSYLGLAFDEDGRILHVTQKISEHPLPFNMAHIGSFLTQICFNTPQILDKVFKHNSKHMEMKLKYSKKNKQPTSVFFSGKVLLNEVSKMKIFIGYACIPDRRDMLRDPFMFNTGLEVWINSNYDIIKSHSWLDLLLEDSLRHLKGKPLSLLSLLHPDDLGVIEESERQMACSGFFKVSCRVYTGENYLWLAARGYPQDDRAEIHVWPFASESIEGGEISLLDGKKLWTKRQKRVKKDKIRNVTISSESPESDGGYEGGVNVDTLDSAADVFAVGVKRSRSEDESSCDGSERFSPKKMVLSNDDVISPEPLNGDVLPTKTSPFTTSRTSAFEVRSSHNNTSPTFIPVTGSIPVVCVKPMPCKVARMEPVVKRTEFLAKPSDDWIKQSPEIISPEPRKMVKPEEVSVSQIERLVKMNTVLSQLRTTNPALYTEFAGVLDVESGSDDKVLKMLPLIIKLQQHDTPAHW